MLNSLVHDSYIPTFSLSFSKSISSSTQSTIGMWFVLWWVVHEGPGLDTGQVGTGLFSKRPTAVGLDVLLSTTVGLETKLNLHWFSRNLFQLDAQDVAYLLNLDKLPQRWTIADARDLTALLTVFTKSSRTTRQHCSCGASSSPMLNGEVEFVQYFQPSCNLRGRSFPPAEPEKRAWPVRILNSWPER